ncbi:MAG: hypothetical protein GF418_13285 [Chitinivibrionales bacterium]|nr:hypothetical protein [Chitinivibrionales bacterium]MBD3396592.1 hypothetical protein [Chitinivibrionales bacterium]
MPCLLAVCLVALTARAAAPADAGAFAVAKRNEDGYLQILSFLGSRLRGDSGAAGREERSRLDAARSRWLAARFPADSAREDVQTSWPRKLPAPVPGIGLASLVLALHEQGFGVVGANRLSSEMVKQARQRKAIVLLETDDGYLWVRGRTRRGAVPDLMLSDGSSVACGDDPLRDLCRPQSMRQWILVFPYEWQACAFFDNTRALAQSARAALFWYPQFLEKYLLAIAGDATDNPLPSVPRFAPCD